MPRVFLGRSTTREELALQSARWDRLTAAYEALPESDKTRIAPFYQAAVEASGPGFDAYQVAIRTGSSMIANLQITEFVRRLDDLERELNQAPYRQPPVVIVVPEGSDVRFDPETGFTTEPATREGEPSTGTTGSGLAKLGIGVGVLAALGLGAWAVLR